MFYATSNEYEVFVFDQLGEIGLCKSAKGRSVDMDTQMEVFKEQLHLAADLSRAVVIHCVGAHGKMLSTLQEISKERRARQQIGTNCLLLPPRIVLHSYSGSPDMVTSFLALEKAASTRCIFSFNPKQITVDEEDKAAASDASGSRKNKANESCKKIPSRSLLLETDAPDQMPLSSDCIADCRKLGLDSLDTDEDQTLSEPALVQLALAKAAVIRDVPMEELAVQVYANTLEAFDIEDHSIDAD
jgi:TatD DNase family protein